MYFLVDHQAGEVDSLLLRFLLQHLPERIVADFSDKCGLAPEVPEHRQYVARRSARIGLIGRISLRADAIGRKIDEKLT